MISLINIIKKSYLADSSSSEIENLVAVFMNVCIQLSHALV